jgi:hypothetical protein
LTRDRLRGLRHYRRQRAQRNAQLLTELRRGWLGRLVLWLYNRRVQREMRRQLGFNPQLLEARR